MAIIKTSYTERTERAAPREKVSAPVRYRIQGKTLDGVIIDLSEFGACINGEAGEVMSTIVIETRNGEIRGQIRWEDGDRMGVLFAQAIDRDVYRSLKKRVRQKTNARS